MPSESVSTRSTVAPGYLARAAAWTLLAVSPVSRCSSGRWLLDSSTVRPVCGAPGAVTGYEPAALVVVLAAFAVSVPASTPPTISPPAIRAAFAPQRRQPRRSSGLVMVYLLLLSALVEPGCCLPGCVPLSTRSGRNDDRSAR